MNWLPPAEVTAEALAARLARGELGLVPTDTVHGLICAWDCATARQRIYTLKGRDARKPLQVLLADLRDAGALGVPPTPALRRLAEHFWPGPLTIIAADDRGNTHGMRVPDHDLLRAIIRALGKPLAATSANPADVEPAISVARDFADLEGEPDFAVRGETGGPQASTVVYLGRDICEVRRAGGISPMQLRDALGPAAEVV